MKYKQFLCKNDKMHFNIYKLLVTLKLIYDIDNSILTLTIKLLCLLFIFMIF